MFEVVAISIIALCLCASLGISLLMLAYRVVKRRWDKANSSLIIAATCGIAMLLGPSALDLLHDYRLFGAVFAKGKAIEEFHCCYDHHGDGIDYLKFKGDREAYLSLTRKLKTTNEVLPSPSLNINNFRDGSSWVLCTELKIQHSAALAFALNGASMVRIEGKDIKQDLEELINSDNSLCAFNFDGDDIDFWLVEPSAGILCELSYYK